MNSIIRVRLTNNNIKRLKMLCDTIQFDDDYDMEIDAVDFECDEEIDELDFIEELQLETESERYERSLYCLVDRIFKTILSSIEELNKSKPKLIKKQIQRYKEKYLTDFYAKCLVNKFKKILFEISYIKKRKDERDEYLHMTSSLVILRTINYILMIFDYGFIKDEDLEKVGQKILNCF